MPRYNEIQVRFLRRLETDPRKDDILRINRTGENAYRVIYTEKSGGDTVVDIMNYTNQQLLAYLYRMLWLVGIDEDPFQSIQVFVPGYPTCLFHVGTLKQNVAPILDLIISSCWNWPTASSEKQGTDRVSSR